MNIKKESYVVVTGATGGLGLNLCEYLLKLNYKVLALGRDPIKEQKLLAMGAEFLKVDIREAIILKQYSNISMVIHCAALSSPWGDYNSFKQSNVIGTQNLINLALQYNCPLIHISTPSIYFDFSDQLNIKENSKLPKQFASFYTETKKQAEDLVLTAQIKGLKSTILRPRAIFGPSDTALIPRILKIATKGYFPLINRGEALIDITYVDNVSHAIVLCMKNIESANGKIFNITNDQPLKVKDILQMLFSALKLNVKLIPSSFSLIKAFANISEILSKFSFYAFEPKITKYTLGLISYSQTLDIKEAKELLGYQPIVSIEEGIEKYKRWYFDTAV